MPSIFYIDNLSFGYTSAPVLRGMSTDFASGEFAAIVGPFFILLLKRKRGELW